MSDITYVTIAAGFVYVAVILVPGHARSLVTPSAGRSTRACALNNAYMQHSLLALVVIPELRISDIGLIDVLKFQPTEVLVATTA